MAQSIQTKKHLFFLLLYGAWLGLTPSLVQGTTIHAYEEEIRLLCKHPYVYPHWVDTTFDTPDKRKKVACTLMKYSLHTPESLLALETLVRVHPEWQTCLEQAVTSSPFQKTQWTEAWREVPQEALDILWKDEGASCRTLYNLWKVHAPFSTRFSSYSSSPSLFSLLNDWKYWLWKGFPLLIVGLGAFASYQKLFWAEQGKRPMQ